MGQQTTQCSEARCSENTRSGDINLQTQLNSPHRKTYFIVFSGQQAFRAAGFLSDKWAFGPAQRFIRLSGDLEQWVLPRGENEGKVSALAATGKHPL